MKKILSSILIISMMFTIFLPLQVSATQSSELELMIATVKQKISIPSNLTEFNYSVSNNNGINSWNLSWGSKDNNDGTMNVNIRQDKTILYYYYYKPYDSNMEIGKFPKLSRETAQKIALDFIKKVNPDVVNQIKLKDDYVQSVMDGSYNFNFTRMNNNIPLRSDYVSLTVNKQDGTVEGYNLNWTKDLVFPSSDKIIPVEDTKKAYKDKLGLKLVYEYKAEGKKITTYPVYIENYKGQYINALTGEKVELQSDYYGPYYGKESVKKEMNNDKLTPEEQKAVDETAKTISKEDAEKIARESKVLEITDDYKLENANFYKDYVPTGNLSWNLSFMNKVNQEEYKYASVTINAITGEIIGFNINRPDTKDQKAKFDENASKAKVEAFLKDFCPEKYNNSMFDDNYKEGMIPLLSSEPIELPKDYSFRYFRKVNGVPFVGNYLTVNYDAVNDKVVGLSSAWFETGFQKLDGCITIDTAYEKMFKDVGYQLEYKLKNNTEIIDQYKSSVSNEVNKLEVYLVYAPNPEKPLNIDANKGIILDADGNPYKDKNKSKYTDIDNSFAKNEIGILAEYNISFEGDKFLPQDTINQKSFLYLLSRAINPYETYSINNKKDIDRMYANLIRSGIVKKTEKAPYGKLKKEDSVKFIIRAMNYEKVADLKDIYMCDFVDKNDIKPELIGYVTIAKALKIISGEDGNFNPKQQITREQAAKVIYNYLNR